MHARASQLIDLCVVVRAPGVWPVVTATETGTGRNGVFGPFTAIRESSRGSAIGLGVDKKHTWMHNDMPHAPNPFWQTYS